MTEPAKNMMYREINEVLTLLSTRIKDEELSWVRGSGGNDYAYVPWEKSVRILTDIFGPFGWKMEIIDRQSDTTNGIYSATVRVTVYAITSTGIIETSRDGVGVGIRIGDNVQANDTAIKAAASDALSRAVKLLGDAFGMFLYDRGDPARVRQASSNGTIAAQATTNGTPQRTNNGPSEAQRTHLLKNGVGAAQVDTLSGKEASDVLSLIWGKNGTKLTGQAAYAQVKGVPTPATNGSKQPVAAGHGDDFNF